MFEKSKCPPGPQKQEREFTETSLIAYVVGDGWIEGLVHRENTAKGRSAEHPRSIIQSRKCLADGKFQPARKVCPFQRWLHLAAKLHDISHQLYN